VTAVFDAYARYYDLLYRDKDYGAEAAYVAALIRERAPHATRLLELGCGTGAHAEHLARAGFEVRGIDQSETMLAGAAARASALPPERSRRLSFAKGDARLVRTGEAYDAVISLFHVMSYQTTDEDLAAAFGTAAAHLSPGGVFLFDFWYGPAVVAQKPENRVKRLEDDAIRVVRHARPAMRQAENVVDVNYQVSIEVKSSGQLQEVRESHAMRYLFAPDIARHLAPQAWSEPKTFAWMKRDAPSAEDWSACALAVRR
jgi:SAM-dependent methyltransferase